MKNLKKPSWCALVLAVCLVGGVARADAEARRERETQIWLEPTWGLLGLWTQVADPYTGVLLYAPAGVNLPLGQRGTLGLELSYLRHRWGGFERSGPPLDNGTDALRFSVGPVFQLSGARPYEGFFVQPLVTATFVSKFRETFTPGSDGGQLDRWERSALALEAGLDVGYGFRWGSFTLTPMIGASVGYSTRASPDTGLAWLWIPSHGLRPEQSRVVWNLNLDLLRLGWVF